MRRASRPIATSWSWKTGLAAIACAGLAACHSQGAQAPEAQTTEVPKTVATGGPANAIVESQYGTPVKDRVATLGFLNKRNNETQDLVMKTGESRRIGNVVVKLATCEKTLPWEQPPETGAFVQVFVEERDKISEPLAWRKVFSGWLFKNSPSLNVVEHPIYDVWVKDCAMKFPGEEESPTDFAKSSKPANASGNDKAPADTDGTNGPATVPSFAPPNPATAPLPNEADGVEAGPPR